MRIYRDNVTKDPMIPLVNRVISQWQHDRRFCDKQGEPKILSVKGRDSQFRKLVRLIDPSTDSGTVLLELERIAAVRQVEGGVELSVTAYVPKEDPVRGFEMLAADTRDLILAVEENIFGLRSEPNFHCKTSYNNIFLKDIPKIRKWILKEASAFHRKINAYLALFDRDIHPDFKNEGGGRVALCTFSRAYEEEAPLGPAQQEG